MSAQRLLDFIKVLFDIRVGRQGSLRMAKKPGVLTMTSVEHLMNYLAEEYLDCLRSDKTVLAKVTILTSTLPKTNNVGGQTEPWARRDIRLRLHQIPWKVCPGGH
jgi:hypothetical protein